MKLKKINHHSEYRRIEGVLMKLLEIRLY